MRFVISVLISVAVLTSASVLAHHGAVTSGFLYNADVLVEAEGEITEVFWRNLHTRARIRVVNAEGDETIWELELGPTPRQFENMDVQPLIDDTNHAATVEKPEAFSRLVIEFLARE